MEFHQPTIIFFFTLTQMVFRRRFPNKKKTVKRRKFYRRRRLAISRNPISRTLMVRMKYTDRFTLNPNPSGVHAYHFFRWNSIFDPDLTGTGHQPLGHDQYANLYKHYYVVGAKATCTFVNTSAVGSNTCIVGLRTDDDAVTCPNGITEITEQPRAAYRFCSNSDGSDSVKQVTLRFSTRKHFGSTRDWNRSNLGADFSASPTTLAYLQAYAAPVDGSQDAGLIACYMQIQYFVLLTDPKEIAQS